MDHFKFPVLYDTQEKQGGSILRSAKGFYDYDRNIFVIPAKKLDVIRKRFPEAWEIIQSVGFEQ